MADAKQFDAGTRGDGRERRRRRVISMRLIVTLSSVFLTTAAVIGIGTLSERHTNETLTGEIETRLRLQARNLALMSSGALLSDYPELTLHPLVKEMQDELPELAFIVVVDHEGIVQGHHDARSLGQPYSPNEGLKPLPGGEDGEMMFGDDHILVASAPVLHPNGREIGRAQVGLYREYIAGMVRAARLKQVIVVGAVLVVGILLAMILMGRLLRPIGALRAGLERIGHGDLDTPLIVRGRTELGLLAEAVNDMSAELKRAQAEMVEKERLDHEMNLAREIQGNLLPASPLVAGEYRVEGAHRAAQEVGGDYFDYFELPGNRVGIAVADVSGKGLGGCLMMSMLSALLRSQSPNFDSPAACLAALEEQLRPSLKLGSFITMFYGILDAATGRLSYASAAHSPLLVYRARSGAIEWQHTKGIPIGAIPGGALARTLEVFEVELGPGDLLVQYTDGVNEAFSPDQVQFDFDRIERCVSESAAFGATAVLNGLRGAVKDWVQGEHPFDDETLLVVARAAASAAEVGSRPPAAEPAAEEPEAMADNAMMLSRLEEARANGRSLVLPAEMDSLRSLHDWLRGCDGLDGVRDEERRLIESALYEACANIIEHGYGSDPDHCFELWWVPPARPSVDAESLGERLAGAYFLLRDEGQPFRAESQLEPDLNDPATRRRGRGLGLSIIRRVVSSMRSLPETALGNLTLMEFHPAGEQLQKETLDV